MSSPSPQNMIITTQSFFSCIFQSVFFEASGWCSSIQHPLEDPGLLYLHKLVGGFNPFEKYESNWIISPRIGMNIKNMWVATTWVFLYPMCSKSGLAFIHHTVSPVTVSCRGTPARRGVPHRSQSFATRRRWYRRAPLTSSASSCHGNLLGGSSHDL